MDSTTTPMDNVENYLTAMELGRQRSSFDYIKRWASPRLAPYEVHTNRNENCIYVYLIQPVRFRFLSYVMTPEEFLEIFGEVVEMKEMKSIIKARFAIGAALGDKTDTRKPW